MIQSFQQALPAGQKDAVKALVDLDSDQYPDDYQGYPVTPWSDCFENLDAQPSAEFVNRLNDAMERTRRRPEL